MFVSAFYQNVQQKMIELNQLESTGLSSLNIISRILYIVNIAADYGNIIIRLQEVGLLFDTTNIFFNKKKLSDALCIPQELLIRKISKYSKNHTRMMSSEKSLEKLKGFCNEKELTSWDCFEYPTNDGIFLKGYLNSVNAYIDYSNSRDYQVYQNRNPISLDSKSMESFEKMAFPTTFLTNAQPKIDFNDNNSTYVLKPDSFFTVVEKIDDKKMLPSVFFESEQHEFLKTKDNNNNV